jgi:cytochrome c-type biogenesis protein CcmH
MVQAPGDTPLIDVEVHWAQAAFLAAGSILDTDAQGIVDRIQTYRTDHPSVLELLTLDAIQRRQHERVVNYSDRALRQEIVGAQRDFFERALVTARSQLSSARPHVNVFVDVRTVPKELSWLLVYARSESAGPPLAVVRRPLDGRDSFNVTLDDAVSMDPSRPISSVNNVYVVARVSVTGGANAHPGDMERLSEILIPNGATVRLSFADDPDVAESK